MKNARTLFGFGYALVGLMAGIAVIGLMGLTPAAAAQPAGFPAQSVPLFTSTIASNATTYSTGHNAIDVPPGCVAYLQASMFAANTGTSNTTWSFSESLDGITWTTTNTFPLTATIALNGTNVVSAITTLGTNLGCKEISLDCLATTQTNAVTITGAKIFFLPTSLTYGLPAGSGSVVFR